MKVKTKFYFYNIDKNLSIATTLEEFIEKFEIKTHSSRQKALDNILTFDTETTVSYHYDECGRVIPEYGFVSMAQFCLDGVCLYCRKIEDAVEVFQALHEKILEKYSEKESAPKLKCYVHNLGYDYQFIKKYFANEFLEAKILGDERSPINIIPKDFNVSFHCSYKLFDRKLAKVAEDYNLKYGKTDGWDYNKYRSTKTKLTEDEIKYGMHDVYALYSALLMKIDEGDYKYIMNVPATKTGEVRYYKKHIVGEKEYTFKNFKEFVAEYPKGIDVSYLDLTKISEKEFKKKKYYSKDGKTLLPLYHNGKKLRVVKGVLRKHAETILEHDYHYISRCRKNNKYEGSYILSQLAYAGGFTHAKQNKLGRILKNIASFDLTSAYPSVMLCKKFVYNWSCNVKDIPKDKNGLIINEKYGYLMKIKLYNLKSKHGISSISLHKVLNEDECKESCYEIDNGRILKAGCIELALYDMDYNSLKKLYTWDKEELIECYKGEKEYLLRSELLCINHFYSEKSIYKAKTKIEGLPTNKKEEYNRKLLFAKQQLNSLYGCIAMDDWKYFPKPDNYDELPEKKRNEIWNDFMKENKQKRNVVTIYSVGGQVTSYVRGQIFDAIEAIGFKDLVYSDTDSIKFEYPEKHMKDFDKINEYMQEELKISIKDNYIQTDSWVEMPNKFDFEGIYYYFVTLGAKRYICVKDKKGHLKTIREEYTDNNGILDIEEIEKTFKDIPYSLDDPYIECTVAGIPKVDMLRYLQNKGGSIMNKLRHFKNGICMERGTISKELTTYVDNEENEIQNIRITSYMGKDVEPTIESVGAYIVLSPASFKIGLSTDVIYAINKNLGNITVGITR